MKQKILLCLAFMVGIFGTATAAGIPICLTNSYGEQASLIFTAAGGGMYSVSGTQNYTPYGSTEWPVSGTFNKNNGVLHYVATNPNPDNCTNWANSVTFNYTATSRSTATGAFTNDCGLSGALDASGAKGDCGYFARQYAPGEFGATGAHKMNLSKIALPNGQSLLAILGGITMNIAPNPVLHTTKIEIKMDRAANVRIQIYDQFGNLSRTILNGNLKEGVHEFFWNRMTDKGSRAPQGSYFVKVISEAGEVSQQILVIN